ncbi:TPA: hypothetical protein N0F65_012288 [Lagenidium giganteum]|uniref:Uncharacterized protein n=1 Tax=Lagenidium giganteum TaxID=4803 RepID=A0AAV2ZFZ6_9STRA|nr:TPA: hypothetical protein N0F65_012288 [Lagenidium giganteum]
MRTVYSERTRQGLRAATASERRRDMFDRSMEALRGLSPTTIQSSFSKAGPFIPIGPSALKENEERNNDE